MKSIRAASSFWATSPAILSIVALAGLGGCGGNAGSEAGSAGAGTSGESTASGHATGPSGSGGDGGGSDGGGGSGGQGAGGGKSSCAITPADATKVACNGNSGDVMLIQSALTASGKVALSGTCALGSTSIRLGDNQFLGGSATLQYSGAGYAIQSSGNGNTVTGLTLDGGGIDLDLADRTNWTGQYGWNITCNHFQNIISGQNGVYIDTILGKGAHSTISHNTFTNIWGYGRGYPDFPTSPKDPIDGVNGSGIYWQMGLDETTIDDNVFDKIAFNAIKGFWDGFNGNTAPFTGHHLVVSNNVMTKVHRIGIEAQAAGQTACPGGCNYNHIDSDGTILKNNFYHDPALQYDNFGYSWMAASTNAIIANNTAVTENATCFWPLGIALENAMNGGMLVGNVMGAVYQSCAGGYNPTHGWAAYICPGYAGVSYTNTFQNNVTCGDQASAIVYDPHYSAKTVEISGFVANDCPGGADLAKSNIAAAFTSASGQSFPSGGSGTWKVGVVSNLSIKQVEFFVDGSSTPAVTQEMQDANNDFASDRKWLYHASIDVSKLASGHHTIKAIATDVANTTQSASQSFTR